MIIERHLLFFKLVTVELATELPSEKCGPSFGRIQDSLSYDT